MFDVLAYAFYVLVIIGLLRYVMAGIEPEETTLPTPEREP
jgi:hypothetical protein